MEDYEAAFLQRAQDVEVLRTGGRRTAAMHFGGITIECLLKAKIYATMPKNANGEKQWNDPVHGIVNPGHDYQKAIQSNSQLRKRIQRFPEILKLLENVAKPNLDYIDMRYSGTEPEDEQYKQWEQSYKRLLVWLQK